MNRNRSLFLSGFSEEVSLKMHCVSRVVDRNFVFGDEEREMFISLMRKYEAYCGIKVLAYCVMSNHFHILLEIPPRNMEIEMNDAALLERLGLIYSDAYVKEVKKNLQRFHKNQAPKARREYLAKFTRRMGNMSEFMKALKQGFSRWFNKHHGRRGTLWEERYSATAVSAGSAARMVAAYIDLNPVRAGMVADPKDYRWCSYAEAVAGGAKAVAGYQVLYAENDSSELVSAEAREVEISRQETLSPKTVLQSYRMLLAEEGEASDSSAGPALGERKSKRHKRRNGYSRAEIDAILEKNGKLSRAEILRCKTRYFSDGVVIGSRSFVNQFFKSIKENLSIERKRGASPMRKVKKGDRLYSYRDLQKEVYG